MRETQGEREREKEKWECGREALNSQEKGSEKCIKTLLVVFLLELSLAHFGQLFRVMCDLSSFTPTRKACGFMCWDEETDRGGRRDILLHLHRARWLSKLFHLLKT